MLPLDFCIVFYIVLIACATRSASVTKCGTLWNSVSFSLLFFCFFKFLVVIFVKMNDSQRNTPILEKVLFRIQESYCSTNWTEPENQLLFILWIKSALFPLNGIYRDATELESERLLARLFQSFCCQFNICYQGYIVAVQVTSFSVVFVHRDTKKRMCYSSSQEAQIKMQKWNFMKREPCVWEMA